MQTDDYRQAIVYDASSKVPSCRLQLMILATDFGAVVVHTLIGCVLHRLSPAICCLPQLPDKFLVHHNISTRPDRIQAPKR